MTKDEICTLIALSFGPTKSMFSSAPENKQFYVARYEIAANLGMADLLEMDSAGDMVMREPSEGHPKLPTFEYYQRWCRAHENHIHR